MTLPKIIQGGMGVAISNWTLAKAVAETGNVGVVSGTGISLIVIGRLMDGDPGGHVRRALEHFPYPEVAEKMIEKYYLPEGRKPGQPYKRLPMWTAEPSLWLDQVTVATNFVEVWLAKEGNSGTVGVNLLEKVQMPIMSSLYGCMLANVDLVIIGAGIPRQVPAILDKLAEHESVSYALDVKHAESDDDFRIHFDPKQVFPGLAEKLGPIKRPDFYPIVSSTVLAKALARKGGIQGIVVELPIAGGHNAPPRDNSVFNDKGEPVYGQKDIVNLEKVGALGLPFYMAGGYDTPEKLAYALEAGAAGVQIGTAFAYCNESGMKPEIRQTVIKGVMRGEVEVRTDPVASPTGFPFKVVQMDGTVARQEVYDERPRVCDIGYLRHIVKGDEGDLIYRCPAEPVDAYVKKGGDIEDTACRSCLCNNLFATAGQPQVRRSGFVEPPIITSGDEVVNIDRFVTAERTKYSAKDVIAYMLETTPEPV